MTQPKLLELAKQGDPQAIAILMNRSLQPQGMTVKVTREGNNLSVLLQADQTPNRLVMTNFVRNGITNLKLQSVIQSVHIMGQRTGDSQPAWDQELRLADLDPNADFLNALGTPSPEAATVSDTSESDLTLPDLDGTDATGLTSDEEPALADDLTTSLESLGASDLAADLGLDLDLDLDLLSAASLEEISDRGLSDQGLSDQDLPEGELIYGDLSEELSGDLSSGTLSSEDLGFAEVNGTGLGFEAAADLDMVADLGSELDLGESVDFPTLETEPSEVEFEGDFGADFETHADSLSLDFGDSLNDDSFTASEFGGLEDSDREIWAQDDGDLSETEPLEMEETAPEMGWSELEMASSSSPEFASPEFELPEPVDLGNDLGFVDDLGSDSSPLELTEDLDLGGEFTRDLGSEFDHDLDLGGDPGSAEASFTDGLDFSDFGTESSGSMESVNAFEMGEVDSREIDTFEIESVVETEISDDWSDEGWSEELSFEQADFSSDPADLSTDLSTSELALDSLSEEVSTLSEEVATLFGETEKGTAVPSSNWGEFPEAPEESLDVFAPADQPTANESDLNLFEIETEEASEEFMADLTAEIGASSVENPPSTSIFEHDEFADLEPDLEADDAMLNDFADSSEDQVQEESLRLEPDAMGFAASGLPLEQETTLPPELIQEDDLDLNLDLDLGMDSSINLEESDLEESNFEDSESWTPDLTLPESDVPGLVVEQPAEALGAIAPELDEAAALDLSTPAETWEEVPEASLARDELLFDIDEEAIAQSTFTASPEFEDEIILTPEGEREDLAVQDLEVVDTSISTPDLGDLDLTLSEENLVDEREFPLEPPIESTDLTVSEDWEALVGNGAVEGSAISNSDVEGAIESSPDLAFESDLSAEELYPEEGWEGAGLVASTPEATTPVPDGASTEAGILSGAEASTQPALAPSDQPEQREDQSSLTNGSLLALIGALVGIWVLGLLAFSFFRDSEFVPELAGIDCPDVSTTEDSPALELSNVQFGEGADNTTQIVGCVTNHTDFPINAVTVVYASGEAQQSMGRLDVATLQPGTTQPFRSDFALPVAVEQISIESVWWNSPDTAEAQQEDVQISVAP
jgi:pilus assembly protein FimV